MTWNRIQQSVKSTLFAAALLGLAAPAALAAEKDLSKGGLDQAGGTVKGVIKFVAAQKKPKTIRMTADKNCVTYHKGKKVYSETFVFNKNGTLRNTLVYVSKGLEGKKFAAPKTPTVIDQKGCVYIPHVGATMVGQEVQVLNSDKTLHNVRGVTKANAPFNEASVQGSVIKKKFKKAERVTLKCDVHAWMTAHLHVMEHPFYAVTQDDGSFEIKGLPAGEYEISIKHEIPSFDRGNPPVKITVTEGGTAEANFDVKPTKK